MCTIAPVIIAINECCFSDKGTAFFFIGHNYVKMSAVKDVLTNDVHDFVYHHEGVFDMYQYSVTQWIYGNEPLEESLKRLKKYGYDGVELAGEPDTTDLRAVKRLLAQYQLTCSSICGIYTAQRDLSSSRQETREQAVQYVKACIDMADELDAKLVIVVPSAVGKLSPETTYEQEWAFAVEGLKEAGSYAQEKGIGIAVEALNRFETYLVNKLSVAKRLVEEVNVPSVRLMADLFHMNIEERNHAEALRDIASYLIHVHIADNTREAAGLGMTNFTEVLATLVEVGYEGALTMEFLPAVANPYQVPTAAAQERNEMIEQYTAQSIKHLKEIAYTFKVC